MQRTSDLHVHVRSYCQSGTGIDQAALGRLVPVDDIRCKHKSDGPTDFRVSRMGAAGRFTTEGIVSLFPGRVVFDGLEYVIGDVHVERARTCRQYFLDELSDPSSNTALWEKKGASLYTLTNVTRHSELRRFTNRLFNKIERVGGSCSMSA